MVIKAQRKDTKLEGMHSRIMAGNAVEGLSIHSNGGIHFLNKFCVPNDAQVKEEVMKETHHFRFTVHLGETKMYHDLRPQFWWQGMKRDITQFVSKCLTCHRYDYSNRYYNHHRYCNHHRYRHRHRHYHRYHHHYCHHHHHCYHYRYRNCYRHRYRYHYHYSFYYCYRHRYRHLNYDHYRHHHRHCYCYHNCHRHF